jgi:hypothetical protein
MQTTVTVNTDLIGKEFIDGIKKMFPHKLVEITVNNADETDFIESNKALAKELKKRISDFESKKKMVQLKANQIV